MSIEIPNQAFQRGSSKVRPTDIPFSVRLVTEGDLVEVRVGPGDALLDVDQARFLIDALHKSVAALQVRNG